MSKMNDKDIHDLIIERALKFGASVAGIANVDALINSPSHFVIGKLAGFRGVGTADSGNLAPGEIAWPDSARSAVVIGVAHPENKPELDWWQEGLRGGTPGNNILIDINARLSDWLEKELAEKPEVNEAGARTMIEQAETVAEAIQETRPDDKDEVADTVGEGMKAYGGATAEIAEQYAAAMKDVAELRKLVEQMQEKVKVWASQTVEAKRGSLVEKVKQRAKGEGPIKQVVSATDDSIISDVEQIAG